jgi:predicted PurR-regulated permease PerM
LEKWKIPRALAIIICLMLVIALLGGAVALIVNQFVQFGSEIPIIADKLAQQISNIQDFIETAFNIPIKNQSDYLDDMILNTLQSGGAILTSTATGTLGFLMTTLLIILYIFFIMYYRTFFKKVLYQAFAYKQHEMELQSLTGFRVLFIL